MAHAYTLLEHAELIFEPYPLVVDPKSPPAGKQASKKLLFDPEHKDFDKVVEVLDKVSVIRLPVTQVGCR